MQYSLYATCPAPQGTCNTCSTHCMQHVLHLKGRATRAVLIACNMSCASRDVQHVQYSSYATCPAPQGMCNTCSTHCMQRALRLKGCATRAVLIVCNMSCASRDVQHVQYSLYATCPAPQGTCNTCSTHHCATCPAPQGMCNTCSTHCVQHVLRLKGRATRAVLIIVQHVLRLKGRAARAVLIVCNMSCASRDVQHVQYSSYATCPAPQGTCNTCSTHCMQYVLRLKGCATRAVLIVCNMSCTSRDVQHVQYSSCATCLAPQGTAELSSLTEFKSRLFEIHLID